MKRYLSTQHSTSVFDRNMTIDSNSKANSNAAAINLCKGKLMNGWMSDSTPEIPRAITNQMVFILVHKSTKMSLNFSSLHELKT